MPEGCRRQGMGLFLRMEDPPAATADSVRPQCGFSLRLQGFAQGLAANKEILGTNLPDSLAEAMLKAWVSFASTVNPGWPSFDLDRRMTMLFDTKSREVSEPWKTERENISPK